MRLRRPQFIGTCTLATVSLLLVCGHIAVAGPEADADASDWGGVRMWNDSTRTFHVDAVFLESNDGKVSLKKRDGVTITVAMESLSEADQQYVRVCNIRSPGKAVGDEGVGQRTGADVQQDSEVVSSLATGSNNSDSGARDTVADVAEAVRTDGRDSSGIQTRPRTLARTTSRTTARTTVRSFDDRGTRQVVVDGVGTTPDEALKDCFRKAVEIVVGTIIDAETRVEDDKLVMDRILTFSDGYVDTYEEVEEARVQEGLVRRRISATVRRDSLLLACGRAESMSIDASGLYPEAMTKLERRKSAQALLRTTLDLFPAKLLDLQLAGRPAITKLAETTTTVAPNVVIRVNAKKYDAAQDRLIQVLKCLSKQDGTVSARTPALPPDWQSRGKELLRREFLGTTEPGSPALSVVDVDFGVIRALTMERVAALSENPSAITESKPVPIRKPPSVSRRHRPPVHDMHTRKPAQDRPKEHSVLEENVGTVVLISGGPNWRWFKLDDRIELPSMRATTVLRFRNGDGGDVKTATLSLGPWVPGLGTSPDRQTNGVPRTVFVSPSFLYYTGEGYRIPQIAVAKSLTVHGQITLTNDLLSRVKTIDVVTQHEP